MSEPQSNTLSIEPRRARADGGGSTPAYLFVELECDRPLAGSLRCCLADVDQVTIGRGEARRGTLRTDGGVRRLELEIPDARMSSRHAQLIRALGRWVVEDQGSKNGCFVNGERSEHAILNDGDLVELGRSFFLFRSELRAPADDPRALSPAIESTALDPPAPGLATLIPLLQRELAALAQIAGSSVSIVLAGETGTGKEVLARAIHALSGRAGPLIPVNCGALPATLVESELFGHKKGSFSGATEDRPGLIKSADHGTLFLDEIGDLALESQAALLRALQEREVTAIGSARPTPVDFRVIAATHRDLQDLVGRGVFRDDLLARLSGFTLQLPPLRDRREDLGILLAALLQRHLGVGAVSLSSDAARALFRHRWPLNVRELDKCVEAAGVLAAGAPIALDHLPETVRLARGPARPSGSPPAPSEDAPLGQEDVARRAELIEVLRAHQGNISAAARAMGKARMQIQRWIKRYGIEPSTFRR